MRASSDAREVEIAGRRPAVMLGMVWYREKRMKRCSVVLRDEGEYFFSMLTAVLLVSLLNAAAHPRARHETGDYCISLHACTKLCNRKWSPVVMLAMFHKRCTHGLCHFTRATTWFAILATCAMRLRHATTRCNSQQRGARLSVIGRDLCSKAPPGPSLLRGA